MKHVTPLILMLAVPCTRKRTQGLYYYGFRHYSPKMKKWLSKDPISEAGGVNLYQMALNMPNLDYDINGLACSITFMYDHGPGSGSEADNMMRDHLMKNTDATDMVGALSCHSNTLNKSYQNSKVFGARTLPSDYLGAAGDRNINFRDFLPHNIQHGGDIYRDSDSLTSSIMRWAEKYAQDNLCGVEPDCCTQIRIKIQYGGSITAWLNWGWSFFDPDSYSRTYNCN